MRLYLFIISFILVSLTADARAQVSQELGSVPEAWQLTLDVIKNKAQILLIENNGKQMTYRKLIDESQKLQQSIRDQRARNEQLAQFIKDRHGRTDQQIRIEELTAAVRSKRDQAKVNDRQLFDLQRKKADLDSKIQRLKYTISDIELHQQAQQQKSEATSAKPGIKPADQLSQLRAQMEEQSRQEVLLENQLSALKVGGKTQNLNADAIDGENKLLEARLDLLRLQKLRHAKRSADTELSQANARLYDHLKRRKDQLEANIYAYESRMEELRHSSLLAMSWPMRKKQLVHMLVQLDSRNNQMRSGIKSLREDIDVLRDQVARLERRLDFAQGRDSKQ